MASPRYFIVGARPVALVPTADGGLDCLALDWQSGQMTRNLAYLTRCVGPHPDVEVDEVDETAFREALATNQPPPIVPWGGPPSAPVVRRWTWREWLRHFLISRQERPWAEAVPDVDAPDWGWEPSADGLRRADTVVPLASNDSSYIERFVTVRWQSGQVHLSLQDSKTGAADAAQELTLPEDWQKAFLAVPWPVTGAQPWL